MARAIKEKELTNTKLATSYGGWVYCTECNENIGYLCYATYDELTFNYQCQCGNHGKIFLNFVDSQKGNNCNDDLIIIKNRLCCPQDQQPLMTILDKKFKNYDLKITCKACGDIYHKTKSTF